ncbi:MAG: hypothetical protein J7J93_01435 [Candidatus Aenigmarchaeota archaeon]|nr:hypothetical protein [Candidatus Aenigmarchaeota archaeon]
MQQLENIKKNILRKILEKEAIERLGRIKLVKPKLANQIELYIVQLYQAGQIQNIITDNDIKNILQNLTTKK